MPNQWAWTFGINRLHLWQYPTNWYSVDFFIGWIPDLQYHLNLLSFGFINSLSCWHEQRKAQIAPVRADLGNCFNRCHLLPTFQHTGWDLLAQALQSVCLDCVLRWLRVGLIWGTHFVDEVSGHLIQVLLCDFVLLKLISLHRPVFDCQKPVRCAIVKTAILLRHKLYCGRQYRLIRGPAWQELWWVSQVCRGNHHLGKLYDLYSYSNTRHYLRLKTNPSQRCLCQCSQSCHLKTHQVHFDIVLDFRTIRLQNLQRGHFELKRARVARPSLNLCVCKLGNLAINLAHQRASRMANF
jgi:hypothetical protein